ncbi:hypothetical protein AB986_20855 [Alkalihalobacillus macyae]|uniref:Uncharacterized protein n=1 Tax=Guptibacillus hwajinpoensis TaxID=208199 RepID=A0A0J6CUW2_9BACL|nr:hypothetical protein AB986_20855 [Alkalihalobacillus macyae]
MLDSCGTSGTGETPHAQCFCAPRRLTARPAESEHLERKSTPRTKALVSTFLHRSLLDGNASTILKKRGIIVNKRKGRDNKESKMTLTKTQDVLFGREFKRADRAGQK